jgi:hypothetical protein
MRSDDDDMPSPNAGLPQRQVGRLVWNRLRYLRNPETGRARCATKPRLGSSRQRCARTANYRPGAPREGEGAPAGPQRSNRQKIKRVSGIGGARAISSPASCGGGVRRGVCQDFRALLWLCDPAEQGNVRQPHRIKHDALDETVPAAFCTRVHGRREEARTLPLALAA